MVTLEIDGVNSLIDLPKARSPFGIICSATSLLGEVILIWASILFGTISTSTGLPSES